MKIKILSPFWGHEHLEIGQFLQQIQKAGYDGIETWLPADSKDQRILLDFVEQHNFCLVVHQHEAIGNTFKDFKASFITNLYKCAEIRPLLINSHTGRDYFTNEQLLELVDSAAEFSDRTGILVTHETHRGRMGYSPQMMEILFELNEVFQITADFSHWVCVTESMLENFSGVLNKAISRCKHIHARVGFEEGPQISDPRAPEWDYALQNFLSWWDEIVAVNDLNQTQILPITTEFGPPPYMPLIPFTKKPVANQFEVNCFMKDLLKARYQAYF